ncbi:WXG100 family type VII secretion target [Salinibacterium sp. UTAS2018]|uniref:WXG100 family type VII secretion target n=2 Tax=Salinibacterium TaxID=235888 RepID=UPI0010094A19|nr:MULTISPECIES: WXG100 family type VII secretion target [unclassified Salinibacterium]MBH0008870.1 WXG100 family type VII secretion target [Salinibacterium sp. SWN1162]MBH0053704.1 WXG100 family type VII secretion target [Salinibacterium sp. SWN139]MBH0115995.1 WXG100 family type VII secretion target [Salinibacterium sp. NG253]MBH0129506.1 WXG100 family type VII secretion target [Salinibacterium sp. NK8237]QAV69878.1 WXG100 family type VII secretion target [Salinibacterium sp. UTAS2018]
MANMNVTYSEMTDAAGRLISGKDELITKLTELQTLVNGLVESGFVTDSASGAFQVSYETFTQGTTQAVTGLDGMSTFLTTAADQLSQVDTELGNAIRG